MARILAIDDSEQNLILVSLYLEGTEFELVTARDGRRGLDLAATEDFDLFLVDVAMPGMDGFEVCRRLQSDPATAAAPVILLSGRLREDDHKLQGYEIGAVDYITKPVDKQELLARIRVMLRLVQERRRLEHENARLQGELHYQRREVERLRADVTDALSMARPPAADEAVAFMSDDSVVRACNEAFTRIVGARAGEALAGGSALGERIAAWLSDAHDGDSGLRVDVRGRRLRVVRDRLEGADAEGSGWHVRVEDVGEAMAAERRLRDRELAPSPCPEDLEEECDEHGRPLYRLTGFVGRSACLRELVSMVRQLRNGRSTVLVCGETGTGKELVARALHFDGPFARRPFIPFHCGAISPELIESELFGYEKGSFTGAQESKEGLFAAADTGTIFLDEIAESSLDLQVKLLRVLQLGEIRPVGATRPRHVDVRVIAATNKDLLQLVREGKFREDLYYRLEVVTVRVPPLRERPEDVELLVSHFVDRFNRLYGRERDPVRGVSVGALRLLRSYPWPGNVRELENAIDRAFALGCGPVIQVDDLPAAVVSGHPALETVTPEVASAVAEDSGATALPSLRAARDRSERAAIEQALARCGGDKTAAARVLRMSRSTFYRRLKELGL